MQRGHGDDQLGEVAERRVQKAADRIAGLGGDGLGRMAEKCRQRHDGNDREHKQHRMRLRHGLFGHQHDRHDDEQPEQRIVPDFLEQRLHGAPLAGCDGGMVGDAPGGTVDLAQ